MLLAPAPPALPALPAFEPAEPLAPAGAPELPALPLTLPALPLAPPLESLDPQPIRLAPKQKLSTTKQLVRMQTDATRPGDTGKCQWKRRTPHRTALLPSPFLGETSFVDPNSAALHVADNWRSSRPEDATAMDEIATQSAAESLWLAGKRCLR